MDESKINEITTNMMKKLGDDSSNLILDDIGDLLTQNKASIDKINELQSKVNELEKRNVNLQNVNAKLFNQIGTEVEPQNTKKEPQDEPKKSVSFSSFFDEKGNFKK